MTNEIDGGKVWGAIRSGLSVHRESIKAAYSQDRYEDEAIALDSIARGLTERVLAALASHGGRDE